VSLSGFSVLIIDFVDAYERKALTRAGATVHIVSRGGALVLARNKRINAAFVNFGVDEDTRRLCEELTALSVGQIVITPGNVSSERMTVARESLPSIMLAAARFNRTTGATSFRQASLNQINHADGCLRLQLLSTVCHRFCSRIRGGERPSLRF